MAYKMYDFLLHSLRNNLILFDFYIFPYKIQRFLKDIYVPKKPKKTTDSLRCLRFLKKILYL